MTREEAYLEALGLDEEARAAFKVFLFELIDSKDTAQPPASDTEGYD